MREGKRNFYPLKKYCSLIFLTILILMGVLHGFQKEQKIFPPEKHEVVVRLVLVDIIVTDREGNFVTDLTKNDFELYEDGIRVPINSMDLINLEKGKFEAPKKEEIIAPSLLPRENRLVVIFDSINTIRRTLERNRQKIIDRLIELIKLGREIMVLELTGKKGIVALQPFTREEKLLIKAVERAAGSIWVEKEADILETVKDEIRPEQAQVDIELQEKAEEFDKQAYQYFLRMRSQKTIGGLLAAMNIIKDYPGRKTILFISGGFPLVITTKIFDPFNLLHKPGVRRGDEVLDALIHFANSHNITFYALDPDSYINYLAAYEGFAGGNILFDRTDSARAETKLDGLHSLNLLAQGTGGVSLKGSKRFENFYQVVKRDLTYYYELSYYPGKKKASGEYHKLEVKVNRPGVNVRFRKGYSDYSKNQREAMLFSSASYNPSIFKQMPFEASAIPFVQSRDKFILWMNIALPVRNFISENAKEMTSKTLKLNTWIRDPNEERAYTGQISVPLQFTPSFLEHIKGAEYLAYNYRSGELKLKKNKYQAVFALYDENSGKMGTVDQTIIIPDLKIDTKPQIVNVILGNLTNEIERGVRSFTLSKKEGTLELSKHKFYPVVTNHFKQGKKGALFFQIYFPQNESEPKVQLTLYRNGEKIGQLTLELIDKFWNDKAKIWNAVYNLDFSNISPGDFLLEITISNLDFELKKEIRLTITT